jgi:hypothetical protein
MTRNHSQFLVLHLLVCFPHNLDCVGLQGTKELVANYDRMSVNLPTSSGNPEALRVAATTTQYGKFGVAQQMHTHSGFFYGARHRDPEYLLRPTY